MSKEVKFAVAKLSSNIFNISKASGKHKDKRIGQIKM